MSSFDSLTYAERRVLLLRAEGLPVKDVAGRIGVSEQTVKNQMTAIYVELGVDNIIGALRAVGWLQPPEAPPVSEIRSCPFIGKCGRPVGHRGHHGGFRATGGV